MTKRRTPQTTAQAVVAKMTAERKHLLQRIVDLELALSACVTCLGGEARLTDYMVVAAGKRPLEYHRIEATKTTVIRVKPAQP